MNLGKGIKENRLFRGLTQQDLAEKVHITKTYLSCLENNHAEPSIALLKSICRALDISMEVLFWTGIEEPKNSSPELKTAHQLAQQLVGHLRGVRKVRR